MEHVRNTTALNKPWPEPANTNTNTNSTKTKTKPTPPPQACQLLTKQHRSRAQGLVVPLEAGAAMVHRRLPLRVVLSCLLLLERTQERFQGPWQLLHDDREISYFRVQGEVCENMMAGQAAASKKLDVANWFCKKLLVHNDIPQDI